jgi:hypothetical protein
MKASEIITRAYAEVVASKSSIQPSELQDGLRYLNRMMASLEAKGIELGYTSLSSVDDEVTVSNGVILGMVKNLALTLWPQYSTDPVNPLIKFSADRTMGTMLNQAINVINPSQFPSTLPVGSGNYDGVYQDNFYTNERGKGYRIAGE